MRNSEIPMEKTAKIVRTRSAKPMTLLRAASMIERVLVQVPKRHHRAVFDFVVSMSEAMKQSDTPGDPKLGPGRSELGQVT